MTGEGIDAAAVAGTHPYDVETHDTIGSTNDRAKALAREGRRDVAVLAAEQTAGRGRRGRSWAAPRGGLYCSVVLAPALPPEEFPLVTLAAGVAVVRAVSAHLGAGGADEGGEGGETHPAARLKWPNDVLVGDRKLAGVLTERVDERVVVGVGLNVEGDPADLPAGATTLRATVGPDAALDRATLARDSLAALADLLARPDAVLPAWRAAADTLGRRVRVETPDGSVVGEAVAVERPGRLVVRTDDGDVTVAAGDCEHLRPADGGGRPS